MNIRIASVPAALLMGALLAGCEASDTSVQQAESASQPLSRPEPGLQLAGKLEANRLNEASGIQAGHNGLFFVHNDEGTRLFLTDATGRDLGSRKIKGAKNKDWEDIARVPGAEGPLLVLGDIGDNHGARSKVSLYFLREPAADEPEGKLKVQHRLRFSYPDGPRDVEAMAYDPVGGRLLLLSKRDQPPRLYGLPLDLALWRHEMKAEFLGELPGLRPPTRSDILKHPRRGLWVSQPTGMDISPDGRLAAVITYRSLYLFRREGTESWPDAFLRQPVEYEGPPGTHEEAVGFSLDGHSVIITTEGRPAPVYRLDLR